MLLSRQRQRRIVLLKVGPERGKGEMQAAMGKSQEGERRCLTAGVQCEGRRERCWSGAAARAGEGEARPGGEDWLPEGRCGGEGVVRGRARGPPGGWQWLAGRLG